MDLLKIKEGNLVWVLDRWNKKQVKTVVKVTDTRIVLNGFREYNTYKRVNSSTYRHDAGYAWGRSYSTDGDHIVGRARKADLEAQEAEAARKQAVQDAEYAKQQAEETLRQELTNLLPGELYVQGYTNGKDRVQCYAVHGLNETQVRCIAAFLSKL